MRQRLSSAATWRVCDMQSLVQSRALCWSRLLRYIYLFVTFVWLGFLWKSRHCTVKINHCKNESSTLLLVWRSSSWVFSFIALCLQFLLKCTFQTSWQDKKIDVQGCIMMVQGDNFPLYHVFVLWCQEPFVKIFLLWMAVGPVKFEVSFLLHVQLFKKST